MHRSNFSELETGHFSGPREGTTGTVFDGNQILGILGAAPLTDRGWSLSQDICQRLSATPLTDIAIVCACVAVTYPYHTSPLVWLAVSIGIFLIEFKFSGLWIPMFFGYSLFIPRYYGFHIASLTAIAHCLEAREWSSWIATRWWLLSGTFPLFHLVFNQLAALQKRCCEVDPCRFVKLSID